MPSPSSTDGGHLPGRYTELELAGLHVLRIEHDVFAVLDLEDHRTVDLVLAISPELDRTIECLEALRRENLSHRFRIGRSGLLNRVHQNLASRRGRGFQVGRVLLVLLLEGACVLL